MHRKLCRLTGRTDAAKQAYYKVREGQALVDAGQGHEARLCFKEALKIDPSCHSAMLALAKSYIGEGREDDAFEWLARVVTEHPEAAPEAVPLLERLLFDQGRFGEIEPLLRKAVDKVPSNTALMLALVDLLARKGEVEEALVVCDQALEASPGDLRLQLHRLRLLRRKEDYRAFDRALDGLIEQADRGAG